LRGLSVDPVLGVVEGYSSMEPREKSVHEIFIASMILRVLPSHLCNSLVFGGNL
jgi:hypothetical protein